MPRAKKNEEMSQEAGEDAVMEDAPTSAQAEDEGSHAQDEELEQEPFEDEVEEKQRVRLLPGSTPTAASFEFLQEGHTLGNALRYIIMKNPDVELCAYAIPHPSEDKMNIRIQTYEGTAIEALEKGFRDLQDLCDVVADKFWASREAFSGN
ncbi:RBP11-like subunits of RNA polymerase [Thozetella sp. PMI_491]|nr:RBP11-like subunits of RNA polymerase [Thozetella sp. PMI_491]